MLHQREACQTFSRADKLESLSACFYVEPENMGQEYCKAALAALFVLDTLPNAWIKSHYSFGTVISRKSIMWSFMCTDSACCEDMI